MNEPIGPKAVENGILNPLYDTRGSKPDRVTVRHRREVSTLEDALALAEDNRCGLRVVITEQGIEYNIGERIPSGVVIYEVTLRLR